MAEDERYTEFGLKYRLVDLTAIKDATVTFQNVTYSDQTSLLNRESFGQFMTMEHNFSVLDGNLSEFKDTPDPIGLWSSAKSGSAGAFTNVPTLTVDFQDYHSTRALTLYFIEDYPNSIRIRYFKDSAVISNKIYTVDSLEFTAEEPVQIYNKIIIEFLDSHIPDRYIKMTGLMFGQDITWTEDTLRQATLVQDISRISDMISINTLNFELIDLDNSLNFGNSDGIHNFFQRKQELLPFEIINDTEIPLGKFYLDSYSYELNLGKMNGISYMGLMDGIPFNEGELYNGVTAEYVIDKIFTACEFEDYVIDDVTKSQLLYGTIAPTTCRDALRQVLFACGSILDSTDSQQAIKICKTSGAQVYAINRDTKISTKVTKNPYISGVSVEYMEYNLNSEIAELAKDSFEVGSHQLIFSSPCLASSLTISSNAVITKRRTYYVEFNVMTAGEVIISGKQYVSKKNKVISARPYIDPGEIENVIPYTSTLCNKTTAQLLAKKLLSYSIGYELELDIKHIASDISMNDLRAVQNEAEGYDNYLAMFTNRTFDLTGGFIDTAKLIAYFNLQDYYYYTGTELYSGDDILI